MITLAINMHLNVYNRRELKRRKVYQFAVPRRETSFSSFNLTRIPNVNPPQEFPGFLPSTSVPVNQSRGGL